ncbi:hypothetical protein SAMN00777080_0022 [Aquiflexum balticum DSM 16537]|uniref:Uncharacterized protein n=1 Tax=Aquiflexum balticum DSM 16537 TaxID=758820 RepID=A0A1W2GYT0_9BACT|nr:hypothetical protein SAMN00777080_0022 [Aquiflexum balticum DSM 16537]
MPPKIFNELKMNILKYILIQSIAENHGKIKALIIRIIIFQKFQDFKRVPLLDSES